MRPIKIYALAKAVTKFPQHAFFAESARAIFHFFFQTNDCADGIN
jgi:hypothetical protein